MKAEVEEEQDWLGSPNISADLLYDISKTEEQLTRLDIDRCLNDNNA